MRVTIGSDHRGVQYRGLVKAQLQQLGHAVVDVGPDGEQAVDYPDYAQQVAGSVACGESERGVLICANGIGMSMAANRFRGVRAALCMNRDMASASRRHNDANILCLGQDTVPREDLSEIVRVWMTTEFEGGRHVRRVSKIDRD